MWPFLFNLITLVLRAPWTDFDNFWFFRKTKICSFAQSSFLGVFWRGLLAKKQTRCPTKPENQIFQKMWHFLFNLITLVLSAPWTDFDNFWFFRNTKICSFAQPSSKNPKISEIGSRSSENQCYQVNCKRSHFSKKNVPNEGFHVQTWFRTVRWARSLSFKTVK